MSERGDPEFFDKIRQQPRINPGAAEAKPSQGPIPNGRDDVFDIVDPSMLEGGSAVPLRRWLVPEWVPMDRVTALYGAGGEGKTRLAQMLATACAIGAPWLGLPVRKCGSLLLFCEDDKDEMHRRQEEINSYYGCSYADLGLMHWFPRLGHDNALMRFDGGKPLLTDFVQLLRTVAVAHSKELVIADTLADVFPGNENDRGQARAFAQQALGWLARETKGAVMVLAHPSRAGMNSGSGESGSTVWIGTFRSQLYLSTPTLEDSEPTDPDARVLTRKKANAARRDETIELRWHNGVFVPKNISTGIIASIERRTCERVFLDLLDRSIAEGQHVSHNSRAGNYAPRVFALRPDREGFTKINFERAMHTHFAANAIMIGTHKDAGRRLLNCIIPRGAHGAHGCS